MSAQLTSDYYVSRRQELLHTFARIVRSARRPLAARYGNAFAESVIAEAQQEYAALIPRLPYIGGKQNPLTFNLVSSAWFLALYRVLKRHGKSVDEIGPLAYELFDTWLGRAPSMVLRLYGRLKFTRSALHKISQRAEQSQQRLYPGDWVYTTFRGSGEDFDWGVDYTACGICTFFEAEGAEELLPYLCTLDFPMSERMGLGLVRTTTIGEGAERCDFRFKRNRATRWPSSLIARIGFGSTSDKLKVLVYGAGVLGSLYAARLHDAGHDVSLLARGQRLADLRQHGIVLEDAITGQQTVTRVNVVESLSADDAYDLVIVLMRKNQVSVILPTLAANRHTPNVLFMVNNAAGPDEYVRALGRARVMLGFPGAGGTREGHVICYVVVSGRTQPTTLGELDGQITMRLKQTANLFRSAGFAVELSSDMDAWLKTHVALVSPVANGFYMVGGDNYRLAHMRDSLVLTIRAVREGFRVLRALGIPITPAKYRLLEWLPEPLLVAALQRGFNTRRAEIAMARHANAARDEMSQLADEFSALAHRTSVPTPAIDQLRMYLDPAVPAVDEGSDRLPIDWRSVLVGLEVMVGSLAIIGLLVRRRRLGISRVPIAAAALTAIQGKRTTRSIRRTTSRA